jgi:hypothetical protein
MRGCGGLRAKGTKFLAENLIMVFGWSKCYVPEPEIYVWGTLRDACRGAQMFGSEKNNFCGKFYFNISGANYMFHKFL